MAGDLLFQKSREAGHVDFFISHSWKAERWSKFLALCMPPGTLTVASHLRAL